MEPCCHLLIDGSTEFCSQISPDFSRFLSIIFRPSQVHCNVISPVLLVSDSPFIITLFTLRRKSLITCQGGNSPLIVTPSQALRQLSYQHCCAWVAMGHTTQSSQPHLTILNRNCKPKRKRNVALVAPGILATRYTEPLAGRKLVLSLMIPCKWLTEVG